MTDFRILLFEVRDCVTYLTLKRPEAAKAINVCFPCCLLH